MKKRYIAPTLTINVVNTSLLLAGSTIDVTDQNVDNNQPMLSPIWGGEEENQ